MQYKKNIKHYFNKLLYNLTWETSLTFSTVRYNITNKSDYFFI